MGHDGNVPTVVGRFGEDLRFSQELTDEPAWADYYKQLFPMLVSYSTVPKDSLLQRQGVDRLLVLDNGHILTIDEKKRRKAYSDILLEIWSDKRRGTPGWAVDRRKKCDYVAYAIPKLSKCYFLPYPLLREAAILHHPHWAAENLQSRNCNTTEGYLASQPPGQSWSTWNVAVDWLDLKLSLEEQMHRAYDGGIALRDPCRAQKDKVQLTLDF